MSTNKSEERLNRLASICKGLQYEIQSPHDSRVEEALFLVLNELRELGARHCYGPEIEEIE